MKNNIWNKFQNELMKLNLEGRDLFHTELIAQEYAIFYQQASSGEYIKKTDIDFLVERRGFNKSEAKKLQSLADFINKNQKTIIAMSRPKGTKKPTVKKAIKKSVTSKQYEGVLVAKNRKPTNNQKAV